MDAFPTGHDLVKACRSAYGDRLHGGLVARWVQALAELHRSARLEPDKVERIAQRRADLVAAIENHAALHSQLAGAGYGTAADDLAGAYVAFERKFHGSAAVDVSELHRECTTVARCINAWDDLCIGCATVPRLLEPAMSGAQR